jgi:hypothetical protein
LLPAVQAVGGCLGRSFIARVSLPESRRSWCSKAREDPGNMVVELRTRQGAVARQDSDRGGSTSPFPQDVFSPACEVIGKCRQFALQSNSSLKKEGSP